MPRQGPGPRARARRGIHARRRRRPGELRDGSLLSIQDSGVYTTSFRVWSADRNRPSQIGAVSVQDAAEVQHHQVSWGEHPIACTVVWQRRIGPGRHYRVERWTVVPRVTNRRVDGRRD